MDGEIAQTDGATNEVVGTAVSSDVSAMPGNVRFAQMDATSDMVCITDGSSSKLSKLSKLDWLIELNTSLDFGYPGLFIGCSIAEQ